MDGIEQLKSQIKSTESNLNIHSLFLVIVPILLIIGMNIVGSNHRYRSIAENQLLWIFSYFILSLSLAFVLKVYSVLEALLFVIVMVGTNLIMWTVLTTLFDKVGVLIFPIVIIVTGFMYNHFLRSFKFNNAISEFRNDLDAEPSQLNEYVSTKSEIIHSLNYDSINESIIGKKLTQETRKDRQIIEIDGYYELEGNKFLLAQKRLQLHIIRITSNTLDSLSVSSGKKSLFLDNRQVLKEFERITRR